MIELQQNRYLWVQLVGLATVPLLLDICLAGLASAGPAASYPSAYGLQFWAIAAVGILPALVMQWLKPFYLFSLPPLALKPAALTSDQRRCLKLLQSWQIKALAVVSAVLSLWVLGQLYAHAAQVTPLMTPTVGLISAVVTFFLACTFLQISMSAVRLILVSPQALNRVTPCEPVVIATSFSILGLQVDEILPAESPNAGSPASEPLTTEAKGGASSEAQTAAESPVASLESPSDDFSEE